MVGSRGGWEKRKSVKRKGTGRGGGARREKGMAEEREGAVSGEGQGWRRKRGRPIEKLSVKVLAVQSCLALQPHGL